MEKIRKYFGEYEMTWPKVIIFAVITAVYTALINQVPFLKNTSFQDIAISLECWILFAVFIIVNCKKWWEASLKCFVFFLISQPLIYLIEVPFFERGWEIFQYYRYWGVVTVLTLPGAVIAYQLKRKDWLSVLVLSVANGFLAYMSVNYFKSAIWDFPYHLLSAIFCAALAVFFILVFFDDKKMRTAALVIFAVIFIVSALIASKNISQKFSLGEGNWTYTVEDESVVSVKVNDSNEAKITAKHDGHTYVTFKDSEGNEREYYVTVSGGGVWTDSIE